jgi:N-acetylglucosaminyl-diphospho-decaprenol L-rhamnosyltransferase
VTDSTEGLAVVVVNFRTHRWVATNVPRLLDDGFAGQVIVVDNYSDPDERARLRELCVAQGWRLVEMETNSGFGGGVNAGARVAGAAGARELLVLNPDAWLDPSTARALHDRVRADPDLLLAPLVMRPDGRPYSRLAELRLDVGQMAAPPSDVEEAGALPDVIQWVSGACFALSTALWTRLGGYDEDYFLYWEDVDLCARVARLNGRVAVASDLQAVHDEGQSHGFEGDGRVKSPLYYYYNTRNRLLFASKHLSGREQFRWVRATPRMSYRILLQGGRRQLVRPAVTWWPALRGSMAGVRLVVRGMWRTRSSGPAEVP